LVVSGYYQPIVPIRARYLQIRARSGGGVHGEVWKRRIENREVGDASPQARHAEERFGPQGHEPQAGDCYWLERSEGKGRQGAVAKAEPEADRWQAEYVSSIGQPVVADALRRAPIEGLPSARVPFSGRSVRRRGGMDAAIDGLSLLEMRLHGWQRLTGPCFQIRIGA